MGQGKLTTSPTVPSFLAGEAVERLFTGRGSGEGG
jgi:hypothetical protein